MPDTSPSRFRFASGKEGDIDDTYHNGPVADFEYGQVVSLVAFFLVERDAAHVAFLLRGHELLYHDTVVRGQGIHLAPPDVRTAVPPVADDDVVLVDGLFRILAVDHAAPLGPDGKLTGEPGDDNGRAVVFLDGYTEPVGNAARGLDVVDKRNAPARLAGMVTEPFLGKRVYGLRLRIGVFLHLPHTRHQPADIQQGIMYCNAFELVGLYRLPHAGNEAARYTYFRTEVRAFYLVFR
nr:hypothetical protein PU94_14235 [Coprobacter secundus]